MDTKWIFNVEIRKEKCFWMVSYGATDINSKSFN